VNSISLLSPPAYVPTTASYSATQKTVWDHYNDMAIGVDTLRETELSELADTVLVFVISAFVL